MTQFESLLPNDMVFHMMQFCDFEQMSTIMFVSSEWFRIALNFKFRTSFGNDMTDDTKFKEFSDNTSSLLINSLFIGGRITSEMISILARSKNLKNLTCLDFYGNDEKVDIEPLCKSEQFKNLTQLCISRLNIEEKGFKALSESPYIKNLKHLHTDWIGGGSQLAPEYIVESENFANLTYLHGELVDCLANSRCLSNLKEIKLTFVAKDERLKLLAESKYLTNLEKLMLNRSRFTPQGLKYFLDSNNAKKITDLCFDYSNLGNEGLKVIAECPNMINLASLSISYTNTNDIGGRSIIESKFLKNLTHVNYNADNPYYAGEQFSEEMCTEIKQFTLNNKLAMKQ